MDSQYIKDKNIINRYLHGSLTPEECIEFEEYLIDKPELIEQLEIDSQLMKALPEVDYSTPEADNTPKKGWSFPLTDWLSLTPLKASITTALLCLLGFNLVDSSWQQADGLIVEESRMVFLDTLRSGNTGDVPHKVALPGSQNLSLGIPADPDYPAVEYRIKISRNSQEFSSRCRLADPSGHFFITLDGQALQPGLYLIDLIPCHENLATKQLAVLFTDK
ncbi:hypothetical protein SG34_029030 [Thalassomonas viridans]|uniref:Zinc-finger domain-containing protein n=1 Tax=Thalassomonas viridans TaxID=137584 RepID=A0AAE9Z1W4_9GAMM|nr:hypothetical protein [Thalassomonas viridans]WDE05286.1 hypothetical protein SG34_029030 [Thalassomonas viridans]